MSSKQNLFRPGDIIRERYEILEELGSGGFATTYKAQDLSLGIPVALKVYHRSTFTGQEDALKEAKIAAGLYDLEGIASARDFFGENDIPCIVMEYVKGVSIKDYVREHGRIAGNKMLLLVKPLLKSLIKIHEKGILHRDISADNILLTEDGKLKLIDFGAARFTQKAKDAEYTLIFKRGFAPIEQCSNVGEQGPWTDVYGICATMYYMVTGIIPDDSVNRYVDDQMLPLQRIDGIKLNQHEIACISKGLAVRIEDRYDSIALLYADLYGAGANDTLNPLSDHTTLKPAAFRPTEINFTEKLLSDLARSVKKKQFHSLHRRKLMILALFLLLALTGTGIYFYGSTHPKNASSLNTVSPARTVSPATAPSATAPFTTVPAATQTPPPSKGNATAKPRKNTKKTATDRPATKSNPGKNNKTIQNSGSSTKNNSTMQNNGSSTKKTTAAPNSNRSTNSRTPTPKNNRSTNSKTPAPKRNQRFDGDLDGL